MKALILAAGGSSRLRPVTQYIPKCLVKINTKTIIDLELEPLMALGIKEIIVTTGYHEQKVRQHLSQYRGSFKTIYVQNNLYDSTNYIYSLWLAKDLIDDDILLLHGDLLFDNTLPKRLIESTFENNVLVNKTIPPPEKDFKAVVHGNIVKKIGVNIMGRQAWFCAPIYKLSPTFFRRWMKEIDAFVAAGNVHCYAEDALNGILGDLDLRAVFYENEFCMEIDTIKDLNIAKRYLAGK